MEKNIYNSFKLHRISISCSYPLTMWCLLFPFQMMKTQSWLPGYHFLLCPFLSHCLSLTICIKPPVPSSCFLFFFLTPLHASDHIQQVRPWPWAALGNPVQHLESGSFAALTNWPPKPEQIQVSGSPHIDSNTLNLSIFCFCSFCLFSTQCYLLVLPEFKEACCLLIFSFLSLKVLIVSKNLDTDILSLFPQWKSKMKMSLRQGHILIKEKRKQFQA